MLCRYLIFFSCSVYSLKNLHYFVIRLMFLINLCSGRRKKTNCEIHCNRRLQINIILKTSVYCIYYSPKIRQHKPLYNISPTFCYFNYSSWEKYKLKECYAKRAKTCFYGFIFHKIV